MGVDAADGGVDRHLLVHDMAVLRIEDRPEEVIREVAVGAAVGTGRHPLRESVTAVVHRLRRGRVAEEGHRRVVVAAALPPHAPSLAIDAGHVVGDEHPRAASSLHLHQRELAAERVVVAVAVPVALDEARLADAGYLGEALPGDAGVEAGRMGGVVHRRDAVAPALVAADAEAGLEVRAVEVLALGIDDLAHRPGLVEPAHLVARLAEGGGLVHLVDLAAALHRVDELRHVLELLAAEEGRHRAHDVEAVIERHDGEGDVARRVGGDVNGLELVLGGVPDHLLAARIGLRRLGALLEEAAALGVEVGHRHDLGVGVVLVAEGGAEGAEALAGDADPDLAVGIRLPRLRGLEVGGLLVEAALHLVPLRRLPFLRECARGENRRARSQKSSSVYHGHSHSHVLSVV